MNPDDGGVTKLTDAGGGSMSPAWSPDGRWLAYRHAGASGQDIFMVNMDASIRVNLTDSAAEDFNPIWSPR